MQPCIKMPLLALSRSLLQTGTKHTVFSGLPQPSRSLWGWLYAVFNRYGS
uniref:Uncharacterized protein n=1 Tax=Octopus bimaculoides TaxID=37653 RepID=A0A0L8HAJ0_OCTBM